MNGLGGYLVRRVLGALAVAAAFAVLAWFNSAHAYPATSTPGELGVSNATHGWKSNYAAALTASSASCGASPWYASGWTACGGTLEGGFWSTCTAVCNNGVTFFNGPVWTRATGPATYTCPNGGTLSGTTCNCPVGQVDDGTGCGVPPTCDPPKYLNTAGTACECPTGYSKLVSMDIFGFKSPTAWTGSLACTGGCLLSTGKSTCGTGGCWTEYTGGMGQTCTTENPKPPGSTELDTEHPDTKCIRGGGTPGTVGGLSVCVDKQTGGQATTTTGTPTTQTKITDNGDGTSKKEVTTQTPVTVCTGEGSCTSTTTTTTTTTVINNGTGLPVAGDVPKTDTTVKEGEGPPGACDPAKEDCEPKSQFGGACGGFTCDGDAIQCAIARHQHQAYCDQFGDAGTGTTKAQALADWTAASDGNAVGAGRMTGSTVDASTAFATTERAVGASSLSDWTVHGVVIPLSKMNTPLSYLGYIVLIFSTLWGAQIMFGSGRVGG